MLVTLRLYQNGLKDGALRQIVVPALKASSIEWVTLFRGQLLTVWAEIKYINANTSQINLII